jgi:protocatechuate 3,4-dioxygenase beta subunit
MESKEKLIAAANRLIERLHEIVVEFQVTETELRQVVGFLTEVGQKHEFQLLADVLGISVVVDDITYGDAHDGTAHNVEGPLYRPNAPVRTPPVQICASDEPGDVLFVSGQVVAAADGRPLAHAMLDVWQANSRGSYENEDESQPDYNLRGRFFTDEAGQFAFQTIVPAAYEVTRGGPVGNLLQALGRHAWRPSHIHFKITGDGFAPLTTMLFMPEDPWLDSDAISAVKESLIARLEKHVRPEDLRQRGLDRPFYTFRYDFALKTASAPI